MAEQERGSDSLTRGSLIGILSEVLILPTGLLTAAILTRALGLEKYGLIGLAIACATPVAWIAASAFGLRVGVRVVASAADPLAAASAVLRASIAAGAAAAALFALAAPFVAEILGRPSLLVPLLIASGEVLLLPVARAHRDSLAAMHRFSHAALSSAVFHLTRLAGVVVLVLAGVGVEAVLVAIVLARLAEIAWCRRRLPIPLLRRPGPSVLRLAGLAGPVFLHEFCLRVASSADILLLAALGGSAAAISLYGAASVVAQLPSLVLSVLVPGTVAMLCAPERAGAPEARVGAARYAWRLVSVCAALLLVGAGGASTIMGVLFGAAFAQGAGVLALLLAGGVGGLVMGLSTALLVAEGRQRLTPWIGGLVLAATLLLLPPAIVHAGAVGAAAVTAAARLCGGVLALVLARGIAFDGLATLALGLGAGAAGGLAAAAIGSAGGAVADLAAGGAVTLGALCALGVIDRRTSRRFLSDLAGGRRAGALTERAPRD